MTGVAGRGWSPGAPPGPSGGLVKATVHRRTLWRPVALGRRASGSRRFGMPRRVRAAGFATVAVVSTIGGAVVGAAESRAVVRVGVHRGTLHPSVGVRRDALRLSSVGRRAVQGRGPTAGGPGRVDSTGRRRSRGRYRLRRSDRGRRHHRGRGWLILLTREDVPAG